MASKGSLSTSNEYLYTSTYKHNENFYRYASQFPVTPVMKDIPLRYVTLSWLRYLPNATLRFVALCYVTVVSISLALLTLVVTLPYATLCFVKLRYITLRYFG